MLLYVLHMAFIPINRRKPKIMSMLNKFFLIISYSSYSILNMIHFCMRESSDVWKALVIVMIKY